MKVRMISLAILIIAFVMSGCGRSNLFEATENRQTESVFKPSGETAIAMEVTGGLAGIYQNLTIDANGYARFVDAQRGGQVAAALTAEEFGSLVTLFVKNDFLHLNDRYIQENTADAFNYDVYFNFAGSSKRVITDNLEAPENLRAVIARLTEVAEKLSNNALTLTLDLDREILQTGESVTLTLTAANNASQPLSLNTGGQKFDFFAFPAAALTLAPQMQLRLPEPAWHWSFDKAFIAIVENMTLAPGEALHYSVTWDGKGNNGERLEGAYFIGAQLVASPGGTTALRELRIIK